MFFFVRRIFPSWDMIVLSFLGEVSDESAGCSYVQKLKTGTRLSYLVPHTFSNVVLFWFCCFVLFCLGFF